MRAFGSGRLLFCRDADLCIAMSDFGSFSTTNESLSGLKGSAFAESARVAIDRNILKAISIHALYVCEGAFGCSGIENVRAVVYTSRMKRNLVLYALTVLLLASCSTMRFGKSANAIAHIKSLDGNAAISRGNDGKWEPARVWENLHTGDRARTEPHGKIDFSLGK